MPRYAIEVPPSRRYGTVEHIYLGVIPSNKAISFLASVNERSNSLVAELFENTIPKPLELVFDLVMSNA
jgi:hypothetical protein